MDTAVFACLLYAFTSIVISAGAFCEKAKTGGPAVFCLVILVPGFVTLYHWS